MEHKIIYFKSQQCMIHNSITWSNDHWLVTHFSISETYAWKQLKVLDVYLDIINIDKWGIYSDKSYLSPFDEID